MPKRILVADDSVSIRSAVSDAVEGLDVECRLVADGVEAQKALDLDLPDLVVADVHMPGKSGYQVSIAAKEACPDLPIVLLVGTFEAFDAAAFERCGAEACLKKPFLASDLRERLAQLLGIEATPLETVEAPERGEASEPIESAAPPPEGSLEEPTPTPSPSPSVVPSAPVVEESDPPETSVPVPVSPERAADEDLEEPVASATSSALSDVDVNRIARRLAEILGDGVLREVVWEVVPDLAEVIIRERLEALELELNRTSDEV